MNVDRTSSMLGICAVSGVVVACGWLSYWDIVAVVSPLGYGGSSGHVYPGIIDGTMFAASTVITGYSRRGDRDKIPKWAWASAFTSVASTLGFNIAHGLRVGGMGWVVAALVAVMLLFSVELLTILIHELVAASGHDEEHVALPDTTPDITPDTSQDPAAKEQDTTPGTLPDTTPDITPDTTAKEPAPDTTAREAAPRRTRGLPDEAWDIFTATPDMSWAELARRLTEAGIPCNAKKGERWGKAMRAELAARAQAAAEPGDEAAPEPEAVEPRALSAVA